MSSNRLMYDTCETQTRFNESVSPLQYILDPVKYDNCNKCRMELGVIGGSAVSHIKGNLVDLETDLRGTTRLASKCPTRKYQNPCPAGEMTTCQPNKIVLRGKGCTAPSTIDTNLEHLKSCQMIKYKPVPMEPPVQLPSCPPPLNNNRQNNNNKNNNTNTNTNNSQNNNSEWNIQGANAFENYASF